MNVLYPIFLAIDTSTEICSVAIQTATGEIIEAANTQSAHHTQAILPLIDQILKKAALSLSAIQYITVSVGPGSFTGVRAGIATAQGLAYGLTIPVIPFGTLDLVALGVATKANDQVQVIMDARMQQFYVAGFKWEASTDSLLITQQPCLLSEAELAVYLSQSLKQNPDTRLVGTGLKLMNINTELNHPDYDDDHYPQAKNLILYLNKQSARLNLDNLAIKATDLEPRYVRNQVAILKA